MSEKRVFQHLKKLYPKAHWQRIETWAGAGVFDINGCYNGVEIWVEAKEISWLKKTNTIKAKVRKAQKSWQAMRERAGARTFVGVMASTKLCILPGKYIAYLDHGLHCDHVQQYHLNSLFNV